MKKISTSNIIEFRRKTPVSQVTFINRLNAPKKEEASDGGNYWTTSISTIGNTFKLDNKDLIVSKIDILLEKHNKATTTNAKNMFRRNTEILHKFEDFDFSILKPKSDLTYLSKPNEKSILRIKNVPVQVLPNYVFTYEEENNNKKVGAIWFVAKRDGYKIEEIGVFADALYRFLKLNYSENGEISLDYCIAMDVVSFGNVCYKQLLDNGGKSLLDLTLEAISRLL